MVRADASKVEPAGAYSGRSTTSNRGGGRGAPAATAGKKGAQADKKREKILIVGAGAAGMACAWSLARFPDKFDVRSHSEQTVLRAQWKGYNPFSNPQAHNIISLPKCFSLFIPFFIYIFLLH